MIDTTVLYNIASYASGDNEDHLQRVSADALVFHTKDEYLKWVADWKIQYAQLTQDSRKAKLSRKTTLPTFDPNARNRVWQLRQQATGMLWLRHAAKRKSSAQK